MGVAHPLELSVRAHNRRGPADWLGKRRELQSRAPTGSGASPSTTSSHESGKLCELGDA